MPNLEHIHDHLHTIALNSTESFCYSCYIPVPTGRCTKCGSDDLMRLLAGVSVEFGTDWVIRELLRKHVVPANTLEAFEQSVADCYSETVKIAWIEYDTASAIKELDSISWNIARNEYVDGEVESGNLVTFDDGNTHYWRLDVEQFIRENEGSIPESDK